MPATSEDLPGPRRARRRRRPGEALADSSATPRRQGSPFRRDQVRRPARVRAAFLAACERWRGPLVRAALRAAAERAAALRLRAEAVACFERAFFEPAARPSCLRTRETARERLRDGRGRARFCPLARSRDALRRVAREDPALAGSFTPARRALDSPIAIACLVDRAPCLPSRMCRISSCTNSPACVLGDLPSSASF